MGFIALLHQPYSYDDVLCKLHDHRRKTKSYYIKNTASMDPDVYAAVTSGSLIALQQIVSEKGIKVLKRKDGDDTSCVHVCAEQGNIAALSYLYDVVDDFDFLGAADCDLRTPLHWAAWRGKVDAVKFLVEQEKVNAQTRTGFTPLHYASVGGYEEIVQLLLGAGANVTLKDQEQQSAIDIAYRFNQEKIAKILEDHRDKEIEEAKKNPMKATVEAYIHASNDRGASLSKTAAPTCEQGKNANRKQGLLTTFIQHVKRSNGNEVITSIGYASLGVFAIGLSVSLGVSIGVLTYNSMSRYISNR